VEGGVGAIELRNVGPQKGEAGRSSGLDIATTLKEFGGEMIKEKREEIFDETGKRQTNQRTNYKRGEKNDKYQRKDI
jgi:hypothetical protein